MATFESVHADAIIGKLDLFDRMLFKGYLGLWDGAAFERLLNSQHVLLEDFGAYVKKTTSILEEHLAQIAQRSGRPLEYLPVSMTANKGRSKEDLARSIAERDGITEGLIAVLSTVEPCQSFDVRWDPKQKRLAAVRRPRKGLHYYLYFIDRECGLPARALADVVAVRDPGVREWPRVAVPAARREGDPLPSLRQRPGGDR